jgi:hypothetical protein
MKVSYSGSPTNISRWWASGIRSYDISREIPRSRDSYSSVINGPSGTCDAPVMCNSAYSPLSSHQYDKSSCMELEVQLSSLLLHVTRTCREDRPFQYNGTGIRDRLVNSPVSYAQDPDLKSWSVNRILSRFRFYSVYNIKIPNSTTRYV